MLEVKIKEYNGKHFKTLDKFTGWAEDVIPDLQDKYGLPKKKNIITKIFDQIDED